MKRTGRITATLEYAEGGTALTYFIAYAMTNGEWDIVDSFAAANDAGANAYAEQHYTGDEWYVLDATGRNINGGRDQA